MEVERASASEGLGVRQRSEKHCLHIVDGVGVATAVTPRADQEV